MANNDKKGCLGALLEFISGALLEFISGFVVYGALMCLLAIGLIFAVPAGIALVLWLILG